jgi:hypothetical protein
LAHIDGVTVTKDRCAIGIHAKKISGHKIIVATEENQWAVVTAPEAEALDSGPGTIARQSASCGRTKLNYSIASGVTDDLDLDLRVVSNRERVGAGAGLCVAIDDHRLIESETKATRSAKAISKRDGANVRDWIATRIVRRDVERD